MSSARSSSASVTSKNCGTLVTRHLDLNKDRDLRRSNAERCPLLKALHMPTHVQHQDHKALDLSLFKIVVRASRIKKQQFVFASKNYVSLRVQQPWKETCYGFSNSAARVKSEPLSTFNSRR